MLLRRKHAFLVQPSHKLTHRVNPDLWGPPVGKGGVSFFSTSHSARDVTPRGRNNTSAESIIDHHRTCRPLPVHNIHHNARSGASPFCQNLCPRRAVQRLPRPVVLSSVSIWEYVYLHHLFKASFTSARVRDMRYFELSNAFKF